VFVSESISFMHSLTHSLIDEVHLISLFLSILFVGAAIVVVVVVLVVK